ncbi:hypothetical protein D9M73_51100 [compost metagenome]
MSEISVFEKQLNPGLSFDKHIERLTLQVAELVEGQEPSPRAPDAQKFLYHWDAWVLDLPQGMVDLDLLRNVEFKYFLRADPPADDVPDYRYLLRACGIYAAAAQRAHNRADSLAAWNLLIEAKRLLSKFNAVQNDLFKLKQKAARSARALSNGDVRGQRVRYKIIALLHRDRDRQKQPAKFKSVKLAIEKIDDDLANFIDDNKLQISHVNLVNKVKLWIRDHPAFRAEIAPFFTDGVIEG